MSDPVEVAILLIKERARADAAEARLKRLIKEADRALDYLYRDLSGAARVALSAALLEAARGEEKP